MKVTSFLCAILVLLSCSKGGTDPQPVGPVDPPVPERSGDSGISYQLLVYSFADSDGDGVGDFKGIESKLDYLKEMGVGALWLSPVHKATSYHGYNVEDYSSLNPEYGSEGDFKSLLNAAHSRGMKIYIDYVLNHSSKEHPWFLDAKSSADSPYRDYYHFSTTAKEGWSLAVAGNDPGKQKLKFTLSCNSSGIPQSIKVEKVEEIINSGTAGSGKYLWYGSVTEETMPEFYSAGNNSYTLSLEFESSWGLLVRTSRSEWGSKKFGAASPTANTLQWGVPLNLKSASDHDVLMPWMEKLYYQSVFGSYMPDFNYGPASGCEQSGAFRSLCEAADKWIALGVDGFRLDAVKHIYDDASSDENPTFLKKFYDHCNASFKAAGHSEDIYMVGEQWSEPSEVAPYYKGLNAFFEFAFWWRLQEAISSADGSSFAPAICSYHASYETVRSGAIAATKLSNHDEDRAATALGRNKSKLKLAAAVLLSSGGQPYIYQGEELGYWGSKVSGDEYVRTPVMWKADGSGLADAKLRVDRTMLTADISVEKQLEDTTSVLALYRRFGELRDRYKALAHGTMTPKADISQNGISAWYREASGQKILVIHNFSAAPRNLTLEGDCLDCLLGSNGSIRRQDRTITVGGYSTALYLQ